jgi:methylated-DNA-[protein]-cysteine S-methyltransferase
MENTLCSVIDSPVGPLTITADEEAVLGICYAEGEPGAPLGENDLTRRAEQELTEYFAGERKGFDLPLAWTRLSTFEEDVLRACAAIPAGETRSYSELAQDAGHPGAARATGTTLRNNPWTVVVPCHRVIRADGSLGSYHGQPGDERKAVLLGLDAA